MIVSQFIVLQAIFQNYLFVQYPYNTKEVFICFDSNGTRNESWPSKWGRMEQYADNNVVALKYLIPINSTIYKLRLRKTNGSTQDFEWMDLYSKPPTPTTPTTTNNSTNTAKEMEHEADYFTLWYLALCWYIAFCCSLLVLKLIFTTIRGPCLTN